MLYFAQYTDKTNYLSLSEISLQVLKAILFGRVGVGSASEESP